MKLTTMKQPNPLSAPPSPGTFLYDWVVRSGSYDERPARLYLTARLPETVSSTSNHAEPYVTETQHFQPDVLIDIPPSTTLQDMADFAETGATMIQFFTMPRNNMSVALCVSIILLSLISALMYRNYMFAAVCGLSVSLTAVTVIGGGANQHAKTLQTYISELKLKQKSLARKGKQNTQKEKEEEKEEEEEEEEEEDNITDKSYLRGKGGE